VCRVYKVDFHSLGILCIILLDNLILLMMCIKIRIVFAQMHNITVKLLI